MANSKKKCRHCKQHTSHYIQAPLGAFCDSKCATAHAMEKQQQKREKDFKKRTRELKTKVRDNDRGYWLKQAQAAFNAFIRVRDEKEPCISCGRHHDGQYHAGHYRTVGAHPELRFDELNCHKQCSVCNNHLSGNLLEYRISLIKKIGQGAVEVLEGPHDPKKYSIDDLKAIKKEYDQKKKDLIALP